jgi:phenylalanyl-tRNA synthetase alpha chain
VPYTVDKLTDYTTEGIAKAFDGFLSAFNGELRELDSDQKIKAFLDRWLGRKKGLLAAAITLWLGGAPGAAKAEVGLRLNALRAHLEKYKDLHRVSASSTVTMEALKSIRSDVTVHVEGMSLKAEMGTVKVIVEPALDITLPGIRRPLGAEHPVIRTMNEIIQVFRNLGYSVEEGPEIETDYYNFEALNFPPNHPARDTQDTLFIAGQESKPLRDRLLLRTHTSPVQIRTMEKMKPPVRVVCPGKVHRNDAFDATHSPIFHQIEGLAVDTNITFCDLKGTLDHAMKALFGSSVKTRFYPSFFPFTEPSADVQISCIFCDGKGMRDGGPCRNCKASGWIELLGCGMVDPNVYGFVDYDPAKVSGFAFGMGVERIAILKYGVDDIQLFFNGDVRFLEQFA